VKRPIVIPLGRHAFSSFRIGLYLNQFIGKPSAYGFAVPAPGSAACLPIISEFMNDTTAAVSAAVLRVTVA
jgi:hypothetical protein